MLNQYPTSMETSRNQIVKKIKIKKEDMPMGALSVARKSLSKM